MHLLCLIAAEEQIHVLAPNPKRRVRRQEETRVLCAKCFTQRLANAGLAVNDLMPREQHQAQPQPAPTAHEPMQATQHSLQGIIDRLLQCSGTSLADTMRCFEEITQRKLQYEETSGGEHFTDAETSFLCTLGGYFEMKFKHKRQSSKVTWFFLSFSFLFFSFL